MKTKRNSLIIKALEQGLEIQAEIFSREALEQFDPAKEQITIDIIRLCFSNLGVDYDSTPGKKWYQIFSNNEEVRFINALKLIKSEEH